MLKLLILYTIMLVTTLVAVSQSMDGTHIVGYVRDSLSREGIPYVTVAFLGDDGGVTGNEQGGFTIDTDEDVLAIRLSAVGYHNKDVVLNPGQTVVVVDLVSSAVELDEVLVERTREKYSKKNNPAVELLQRIRAGMRDYDPLNNPYYSYERYERMMYGFNDFDEVASKVRLFRRLGSLGEFTDTSATTGKRVLPISIKEQISQEYYRSSPKTHKQVVVGVKNSGIDESMDQASVK